MQCGTINRKSIGFRTEIWHIMRLKKSILIKANIFVIPKALFVNPIFIYSNRNEHA